MLLVATPLDACSSRPHPPSAAPAAVVTPQVTTTVAIPVGVPMPMVTSAVPSSMSVPALGLTASVGVMNESACPVLKPPTMNDAYWVGCRAEPGTDSDGTVLIIGHSWTGGPAVFNALQGAKVGDDVELTTPSGRLVYRIEHTVSYAKFGEIQASPEILDKVPGRLVLVTCLLGPGSTPTEENFVVQATLVAAARADAQR